MKLAQKIRIILFIVYIFCTIEHAIAAETKVDIKPSISTDKILADLEKRFSGVGFSADFYQESPLPDIGIIESASGKAFFKKPGKFRWEYQQPEKLHYISDSITLWIHNPSDRNLWIGDVSTFFGKESSVSLLTDIALIKKKFDVTLSDKSNKISWVLLLVPSGGSTFGINKIYLAVNKKTGNISKITSFNANNEETGINLTNYDFQTLLEDSLFNFITPENTNIIPLE